ncbi:biotin/lipoyl-binding protein [Thioalkalivibrio sulfidiphilus]|uniref:biotin/lipoyl-binding protein n=1 Tax=Thioalkalivibrio sulfidiphilus TaxID=1033854 RepID=UPI003B36B030
MNKPAEQVIPLRKRNTEAVRREFLPAAMELEATPASPLGRAVIWLIVTLLVVAVVWASIGRVDVIAVAEGSIVPSGKLRTVQPSMLGVVADIRVDNGDHVQAGQPLIVLDSTLTAADVNRLTESIRKRQQRADRLERFLMALSADGAATSAARSGGIQPVALSADLHDPLLSMQLEAFRTMDLALEQQKQAREGELA